MTESNHTIRRAARFAAPAIVEPAIVEPAPPATPTPMPELLPDPGLAIIAAIHAADAADHGGTTGSPLENANHPGSWQPIGSQHKLDAYFARCGFDEFGFQPFVWRR